MSVSRRWFGKRLRRRATGQGTAQRRFRRIGIETLEPRQMLSAGPELVNTLGDVTLQADSPLHIPLDGYDEDGLAVSFEVEISNCTADGLSATFTDSDNRSMRISVADYGEMVFELFEARVPRATSQIITLAESGFYDGIIFHRVIDDFMIQGGDPTGTGSGNSSLPDFDDQFHNDLQHNTSGILSMAKTTDDTNNSQFFITETATRHLDYNHSIFGLLIEGDDVREEISEVETDTSDKPLTDIVMESVEIFQDNQNATLMLKAPEGTSGEADITITIIDDDGTACGQQTFHVSVVPDETVGLGANQIDQLNSNPYLPDIDPIYTTVDTEITYQLSYIDADGPLEITDFGGETTVQPTYFLDEYNQYNQLLSNAYVSGGDLKIISHEDLDYWVDYETGLLTVTPQNGLVGVHPVSVAVAPWAFNTYEYEGETYYTLIGLDAQLVPIVIQPTDLVNPESRLEMSIVQASTETDAYGEIDALPENVDWMDEWESFSVEIWASTEDNGDYIDEFGIHEAAFDLTYNTDYYTATSIEYGDMFSQNRTGTIDDENGRVDNIGGTTPMYAVTQTYGYYSQDPENIEKFGDDKRVLVARVNFVPNETGAGVPMVIDGDYPQPVTDLGLTIENARVDWNVAENTTVIVEDAPAVDVWPMVFDHDEDGLIDLSDLAHFAVQYSKTIGETERVWEMDYNRSGKVDMEDFVYFAANYKKSAVSGDETTYPSEFFGDWYACAATAATSAAADTGGIMANAYIPSYSDSVGIISVEGVYSPETQVFYSLAQSQTSAAADGDSADESDSVVDLLMRTGDF